MILSGGICARPSSEREFSSTGIDLSRDEIWASYVALERFLHISAATDNFRYYDFSAVLDGVAFYVGQRAFLPTT